MKSQHAVARSYTKALFALAQERGEAEAIGRELDRVAEVLAQAADLRAFLGRPWVPAAVRRQVVEEVATALGLSRLGRDFVALVAAQGRMGALPAMATAYHELVDADARRVRARVRTAVPLTDSDRTALAAGLGRALARAGSAGRDGELQVVIEDAVDTGMLGGFVAEVGSLVVDGSLEGQLARLRARLARG